MSDYDIEFDDEAQAEELIADAQEAVEDADGASEDDLEALMSTLEEQSGEVSTEHVEDFRNFVNLGIGGGSAVATVEANLDDEVDPSEVETEDMTLAEFHDKVREDYDPETGEGGDGVYANLEGVVYAVYRDDLNHDQMACKFIFDDGSREERAAEDENSGVYITVFENDDGSVPIPTDELEAGDELRLEDVSSSVFDPTDSDETATLYDPEEHDELDAEDVIIEVDVAPFTEMERTPASERDDSTVVEGTLTEIDTGARNVLHMRENEDGEEYPALRVKGTLTTDDGEELQVNIRSDATDLEDHFLSLEDATGIAREQGNERIINALAREQLLMTDWEIRANAWDENDPDTQTLYDAQEILSVGGVDDESEAVAAAAGAEL